MVNTGREYELFAGDVYQAILRLKGLRIKKSQSISGSTLDEEGKLERNTLLTHILPCLTSSENYFIADVIES